VYRALRQLTPDLQSDNYPRRITNQPPAVAQPQLRSRSGSNGTRPSRPRLRIRLAINLQRKPYTAPASVSNWRRTVRLAIPARPFFASFKRNRRTDQ